MANYEIERKYLIAMPDAEFLASQPGCSVWQIEQVYLTAESGCTRRVRRVVEGGETACYKTFKRRVTALSAEEDEGRISEEQYARYLTERDETKQPILKTRYRVPYENQLLEFDLYPFWTDRAVMEIELESEAQRVFIPEWVKILKEVTDDFRYKNVALASEIPMDEI